jgi:serine protease Do
VTNEIAEVLGLKRAGGALVADQDDSGPAKAGGIASGDVILKLNGDEIKDAKGLAQGISSRSPGDLVEFTIISNGREQTRKITLAAPPAADRASSKPDPGPPAPRASSPAVVSGMTLDNLTAENRRRFNLAANINGVVVTKIDKDAPMARPPYEFKVGYVIAGLGLQRTANMDEMNYEALVLITQGRKRVLFRVQEADGRLFYKAGVLR